MTLPEQYLRMIAHAARHLSQQQGTAPPAPAGEEGQNDD